MSACGKCLYNKNCQFLAKYKIEPDGCTAFRNAEDFVEVVRCKECRYRDDEYECPLLAFAEYTCDDEYCSDGERREDNEGI